MDRTPKAPRGPASPSPSSPPAASGPPAPVDLGKARQARRRETLLDELAAAVAKVDPDRAAAYLDALADEERPRVPARAPCTLLGIDPGLSALGLARLALTPDGERVEALAVIRTDKSSKKREILAAEDNVRRVGELADALAPWFAHPGTVAVCAEAQSWPRNAAACAKVGMAWGVIVALARRHGLPVIQAAPQDVKRATAWRRDASKEAVRAAMEARYPDRPPWPLPAGVIEHAADALAVAVTCLEHPTVKLARRMLAA